MGRWRRADATRTGEEWMTHVAGERAAETGRLFAEPNVVLTEGQSGQIYLECGHALPTPARCVGEWLEHWARESPDREFIAERTSDSDGWRKFTYAEALARVRELAGGLLKTDAGVDRPLAILSENSVDHSLLTLAALHVGIPVAAISTAYSLLSTDHAKLKSMIELLDPSLIYVSNAETYGTALAAIGGLHRARTLSSEAGDQPGVVPLSAFGASDNRAAVDSAFGRIGPDTISRLLFTSGSTGLPKAVINTHRMMASNQEALRTLWPILGERPPVIVDWLPWSHTFGANYTTNLVLRNGGTLYVDDGKPAPQLIGKTIRNIKEVRPNLCFNVPRGYDLLVSELEADPAFRDAFFSMDLVFYAAAALPQTLWNQIHALSEETIGRKIPLVSAWGSTETAPMATNCYFQAETSGNIGLPVPGTTLKILPNGNKLEVRVKGPNVTPGYYKNESATQAAFDAEGFYEIGDAVRLADPNDPSKGLFFDGRVSEDFKLTSGTWVSVGELRVAGIDALAPLAQDIVVTGHDRNEVGFLVLPNEVACRKLAEAAPDAPLPQVLADPAVRAHVAAGLARMRELRGGSSRCAARARFLSAPPSADRGEITDKGYLNQRQVLSCRADDVAALYGDDPAQYIAP